MTPPGTKMTPPHLKPLRLSTHLLSTDIIKKNLQPKGSILQKSRRSNREKKALVLVRELESPEKKGKPTAL